MDKDQLLILIEKYLDGEASAAEKRWVEEWYASFDHAENWLEAGTEAAAAEQETLKHLVKAKLSGMAQVASVNRQVFAIWRSRKLWIAAAVLIGAILTLGVWQYWPHHTNVIVKAGAVARYLVLPDGSTVWLNAGSELAYLEGFRESERVVTLNGEAYFDVVPMRQKPFMVRSGALTTKVLGTAFCVKAYKGDSITVTVVNGKVQVNKETTVMATLTRNERLFFRGQTGTAAHDKMDSTAVKAWDTGLLEFEKQSLRDITLILGKWHGYSFVFHNPDIANCIFTGSFERNAPLREQLNLLSEVNNMNWNIDTVKKQISIDGVGCNE